jgi:hypothetical protein
MRKDLVLALVCAFHALTLLPSEHLHARTGSDPRSANIIHRHLAAHVLAIPNGAALDHAEDAPVRWLGAVFVASVAFEPAPAEPADVVPELAPPSDDSRPSLRLRERGRATHGPPRRAPGLRAPPPALLPR